MSTVDPLPLESPASPWSRWLDADSARLVVLFIVAHTVIWTLVPLIVRWPGALWDDMLENYAWAQEWQLGYYKHPPFYAWIVGLWFQIFPRAEWAYYLLSAVNVGVGFAGIWLLAGRFVKRDGQLLSILLLAFMPYYNYMASNFNANTILLSLWPWTAYAFVRSVETRSIAAGAAFGVLAAAGLLSKYYSILLLASCFAASLAHPGVRRYYASPAPYVAVAVAALLFAPHVWWAFANDLPPLKYALSKTGMPWIYMLGKATGTAVAALAINAFAIGILIVALHWRQPAIRSGLWRRLFERDRWWLLILAAAPFFMTLLLGVLGYVKVSLNFLIPTVFMLPLVVMIALEPALTRGAMRGVLRAVGLLLLAALVLSPVVAFATFRLQVKGAIDVNPQAARDAARLWHETFKLPVRIVAGSEKYSLAQPFYGPDSPSEFSHFSFDEAPWISKARIARQGLLAICVAEDRLCLQQARTYAHAGTREFEASIQRTVFGIAGPKVDLIYVMTPPRDRP
jgi:4-amino-4-deoxy-L-arabinose transferase-like glycosyltransferase